MKALVTVVMSVYNGEKHLKKSITSILLQSYKDFEFIIIDDCSYDNTLKILESFNDSRIVIIKNEENIGLSASLNKGIELSSGKYIVRQDDDDISEHYRLQKQLNFMEKSKDVDAVFCRFDLFDNLGKVYGSESKYLKSSHIASALRNKSDPLAHGAVMIKKESLISIGRYSDKFFYSQDYELWNRMFDAGLKVSIIDYIGYHYRVKYSSKKKWQKKYTDLVDARRVFGRSWYYKHVEYLHKEVARDRNNKHTFQKIVDLINSYIFHVKIRLKSALVWICDI